MDQDDTIWSGFMAAFSSRGDEEDRRKYFAGLYKATYACAYGYARKLVGRETSAKLPASRLDPEDICSEVYYDLYVKGHLLRESPRAWFFSRIKWKAVQHVHAILPTVGNEDAVIQHESAINSPTDRIAASYLNKIRHLRKAVRSLPCRMQEVVKGLYEEGESRVDLARRLRITVNAVVQADKRARIRIEAYLVKRGVV